MGLKRKDWAMICLNQAGQSLPKIYRDPVSKRHCFVLLTLSIDKKNLNPEKSQQIPPKTIETFSNLNRVILF